MRIFPVSFFTSNNGVVAVFGETFLGWVDNFWNALTPALQYTENFTGWVDSFWNPLIATLEFSEDFSAGWP